MRPYQLLLLAPVVSVLAVPYDPSAVDARLDHRSLVTDKHVEKRETKDKTSCGPATGYMPAEDTTFKIGSAVKLASGVEIPPVIIWQWGYKKVVNAFCTGIAPDEYGRKVTIKPGKTLESTRTHEDEKTKKGIAVYLKDRVQGHVTFKIHNKGDKDYEPDKESCIKYLTKMAEKGSDCYAERDKMTKGGTYEVVDEKVSYEALPGKGGWTI